MLQFTFSSGEKIPCNDYDANITTLSLICTWKFSRGKIYYIHNSTLIFYKQGKKLFNLLYAYIFYCSYLLFYCSSIKSSAQLCLPYFFEKTPYIEKMPPSNKRPPPPPPPFFLILFYKRPLRINAPPFSNSFKSCGLNINTNGSEDGWIHCFQEGEPCQNGREQLISQLDVLDEPDRPNPFDRITDPRR